MAENSPESLHEKANTKKPASNNFVNPGTPNSPLVKESDLPSAVTSQSGSEALRASLNDQNK